MKKLLFKKILYDCLIFFLITLISTSIIIWVFQAVNFLDIMIEDGRSFKVYIYYSFLSLPKIISKILPFALFFSLFYVLNKYETSNELVIIWTFGINKIELVRYLVIWSFLLLLIQTIITTAIVPMSEKYSRTIIKSSNISFFESFIKPKRFMDKINNLTIYAEEKNKDGDLKNIYIKKNLKNNDFQITYAKKGKFVVRGKNNLLELFEGETIKNENNKIINFKFTKSDFSLNNFKTNTITQYKIQETSTLDLYKCILNLKNKLDEYLYENCSSSNLSNIFKELLKRILIPFYIPVLTLVSLLLILKPKEDHMYNKIKIISFVFGVFIIILSETSLRFVQKDIMKNIFIIVLPIILFSTLYFNFLTKFNFKLKEKI